MGKASIKKLHPLTSMRALAAGAIIAMHCGGHFGLPRDMNMGDRLPLYIGVSFFFVLSGFILTYVYPSFDSASGYGRFLWARFARIWPCHAFAFLVTAAAAVAYGTSLDFVWKGEMLRPTLANLAMVHSWIPTSRYYMAMNAPSWSISTEFGFYLAFPLLLWRLDRRWPLKLAICLVPPIALMVYCSRAGLPYDATTGVTANGLLYMSPISRTFEFALGMATASIWHRVSPRVQPSRSIGTLLELSAIAFLGLSVYFWGGLADWIILRTGLSPACKIWFSHGLTCFGFAALIFTAALEVGWISRVLSHASLVFLGEISYAAYLLHWPLLTLAYTYLEPVTTHAQGAALVAYVATLLACSTFSWFAVEAPCRRFLIRLLPKPAPTPSEPKGHAPAPHISTAPTRSGVAGGHRETTSR